jgi:hypothetical protein
MLKILENERVKAEEQDILYLGVPMAALFI